MIRDSKDETSFTHTHKLLLTAGQLSRLYKDSVNNLSAKTIHS